MSSEITIGVLSRLCGISVSALRFYDPTGVLLDSQKWRRPLGRFGSVTTGRTP